jgi:hypothetical protein
VGIPGGCSSLLKVDLGTWPRRRRRPTVAHPPVDTRERESARHGGGGGRPLDATARERERERERESTRDECERRKGRTHCWPSGFEVVYTDYAISRGVPINT